MSFDTWCPHGMREGTGTCDKCEQAQREWDAQHKRPALTDSKCVVLPWVATLSFKEQTVLLSALRGCDGIDKEDISKQFTRKFRAAILHTVQLVAPYG